MANCRTTEWLNFEIWVIKRTQTIVHVATLAIFAVDLAFLDVIWGAQLWRTVVLNLYFILRGRSAPEILEMTQAAWSLANLDKI